MDSVDQLVWLLGGQETVTEQTHEFKESLKTLSEESYQKFS